jgi:hypothetical protein
MPSIILAQAKLVPQDNVLDDLLPIIPAMFRTIAEVSKRANRILLQPLRRFRPANVPGDFGSLPLSPPEQHRCNASEPAAECMPRRRTVRQGLPLQRRCDDWSRLRQNVTAAQ